MLHPCNPCTAVWAIAKHLPVGWLLAFGTGARADVQELQRREEAVRNGKLATIVFVRDVNVRGQEVSGYIDYGERLSSGGMEAVFSLKQRFLPRPTDLSFYNWDTHASSTTPTMDFQARLCGSARRLQHAYGVLLSEWVCG